MHIVSECTGSRLATASFVPAFTSQAVPDMWKQLEAMESKKRFGASESSRSAAMDPRTHGFTKKAGTELRSPAEVEIKMVTMLTTRMSTHYLMMKVGGASDV